MRMRWKFSNMFQDHLMDDDVTSSSFCGVLLLIKSNDVIVCVCINIIFYECKREWIRHGQLMKLHVKISPRRRHSSTGFLVCPFAWLKPPTLYQISKSERSRLALTIPRRHIYIHKTAFPVKLRRADPLTHEQRHGVNKYNPTGKNVCMPVRCATNDGPSF